MFELIIKRADGSPYWKEYFNEMGDLQEWITEEKTRKYWRDDFIEEVIDHTPPPPTPEEIAQRQAQETERRSQLATLKARIVELDNQTDITASEVKEQLRKFVKFMKLRGMLD